MDRIKETVPGIDWDNENDDTKLIELGIDSALLIEVCAIVEEVTEQSITEDDMYELTVGEVKRRLVG